MAWLRKTGGWFFPFLALIAIIEVVGGGILQKDMTYTQQHTVIAISQNKEDISANTKKLEDTTPSNARKIEEDEALIRGNRKVLDQIAKDTQKLLEKKCH